MKFLPLDHFGAASNLAVKTLLDAKLNRKERLRAFRSLAKFAAISKDLVDDPVYIAIACDKAGGLGLLFLGDADIPLDAGASAHVTKVLIPIGDKS